MKKRKLLDIYKEMYYNEHDLANKVNQKGTTFIVAISLLLGAFFYGIRTYKINFSSLSIYDYIFGSMIALGVISILSAIIWLYKLLAGQHYKVLPRNDRLHLHIKENIIEYYNNDYYKDLSESEKEEKIEEEIDDLFIDYYKKTNTYNREANQTKRKYYRRIIRSVLATVFILLISFVPYYLKNYNSKKTIILKTNKIDVRGDIHVRKAK